MADAKGQKSGSMGLIIGLVIVTAVAGAAGAGLGLMLSSKSGKPDQHAAAAPKGGDSAGKHDAVEGAKHGDGGKHGDTAAGHGKHGAKPAPAVPAGPDFKVVDIPPITTNLEGEKAPWVRIEGQLIYQASAAPEIAVLSAKIVEDFVVYLRTVRPAHVTRPGGLQSLIEDLNERARLRSGGKIHQLVVSGFILE